MNNRHIIEHHLQYITNIPGHVLYIDAEAVMVKVGAGQCSVLSAQNYYFQPLESIIHQW